jgi:succinyl-diaminopimelate desuccinylase
LKDALNAWVDAHIEEIISETQGILRIPSLLDPSTAGTSAPFGKAVLEALTHTLEICAQKGMLTQNFEGFAGHADFGGTDDGEIVGVLGHLDVVPPGRDWTVDPWGAIVQDGFIWARGASDDKGPTYAALFGAVAVKQVAEAQGIELKRKVRLIFGCDEESEWRCTTHYFGVAGQPKPTVAFTPDADFPLVYAEKGSFTGVARKEIGGVKSAPLKVAAFHSGLRPNMVPDEATAILTGDAVAQETVTPLLEALNATVTTTPEGIQVSIRGVSAHGATPQEGKNAAVLLMNALTSDGIAEFVPFDADWMREIARRGATDGSEVGIGGRDEITGPLTSNLGIVTKEGGVVQATFNVRYPATWDSDETTGKFISSLAETGWSVPKLSHTPPLYVPQDAEPVKTLLRVYRDHTGDMRPPNTMGGRTYATVVAPVGVAFGPAMPGDPEVAHQADERFAVERLIQCAKIYANAIWELAMPA